MISVEIFRLRMGIMLPPLPVITHLHKVRFSTFIIVTIFIMITMMSVMTMILMMAMKPGSYAGVQPSVRLGRGRGGRVRQG